MSKNIVLTREEVTNDFMEAFLASFENFEERFLTDIYNLKTM